MVFKVRVFAEDGRELPLDDADPATIEITRILSKFPKKYQSRAEVRRLITRVCDRYNLNPEFE